MLRATTHHVPIFDGISGFEPPLHRTLREKPLDDSTLDLLEQNGCRFILVRPEWAGWQFPQMAEWLRRGMSLGRIAFVRRFDGGISGDWLFAMPRKAKDWKTLEEPPARDAAGFTPDEELERLLAGEPTYNASTFGQLYQPKPLSIVSGQMTVSGWALSPDGVRAVNVLFGNGSVRIPAGLFPRDDVTRLYPWYPRSPRPAFATAIPQRPPGVHEKTDVQIEIVDGRGRRTLLPDVALTWR